MAHVSVQSVVGTEDLDLMLIYHVLYLKERRTHLEPERFRFIRARDDAAVVIREHYDWSLVQSRVEHPLAADIEVVAINEGKDRRGWCGSSLSGGDSSSSSGGGDRHHGGLMFQRQVNSS